MQNNIAPREASPSPSFRERQRTIKAHSMPIVPSVGQVLAGNTAQQNISQPSPTGSNGSLPARRSPPATSRISPVTAKLASMSVNARGDRTPERMGSPPPLLHAQSTPVVPQLSSQGSQVAAHQPRPMPRVAPPHFLTQFQVDEKWHVTEELLAEIDRADQQHLHGQLSGTSGVAYAGGAASSSSLLSVAKDPAVERVRASDRSSPKEFDNAQKRQVREKEREPQNVRESPKTRERSQTTSSLPSQHMDPQVHAQRTPEYRGSPPFHTPMTSPGERTANYTQYVPDSYQAPQGAPQSTTRKPAPASTESTSPRGTPPATMKPSNQVTPVQSTSLRVSDRALPLQEEPEEDLGQDFTEHESDYDNRRDHGSSVQPTDEDDEDTLNEEAQDHLQPPSKSDDEDSGFTPRSPSTSLPERPRDERYSPTNSQYSTQYSQLSIDNQKTMRNKHARVGSTDQLGMRSFDPTVFESTNSHSRSNSQEINSKGLRTAKPTQTSPPIAHQQPPYVQVQQLQQQQQQARQFGKPVESMYGTNSSIPLSPHFEDLQGVFDNPTSSYLQTFLQSPTPDGRNAPVPPTPVTNTAAPSPSPFPSDIEPRQIGSPYPYPFAHIRRTALSAAQNAATSTFEPNDIAHVREQLQMQMQIYALNNGLAPPSESTFSPSSTPFPGVGYNPWAFMHQARGFDSAMSIRSSPSHEPIQLPIPQYRNRPLRRKDNSGNLRAPLRRKVKPPPRVESTQPRDTSPEPSSGEETAGETQFVDQYVPTQGANGAWGNGHDHLVEQVDEEDEGDWVDDDDDGAEDVLQLEYHHSYIPNPVKRQRRWESRWEALSEAVKAIDRETDTTLLVLAAPAHSKKLHALTSRNIRRDPNLLHSTTLTKIRSSFSALAEQRRASRTPKISLVEQLSGQSNSSADGSQNGESDLRRALEAALGSLGALSTLYDQREARWREEMRRLGEDREHVAFLLSQVLGPSVANATSKHEETQLLG
ncbi:hypothetical protein BDY19DRAFT_926868 [Irpex rosettiformis]|uniref:Uncharacterized protein n=1 Tax=Irpex rosettiformis TaxID=378272 RepID=A0ACB8UF49_9APHY|nr:hypothetical protein BDY19DRAFT_926868 [Irpex rosettiformis]